MSDFVFPAWARDRRRGWVLDPTRHRTTNRGILNTIRSLGLSEGHHGGHSFRDDAATVMFEEGELTLDEVREVQGHATTRMTEKYVDKNLDRIGDKTVRAMDSRRWGGRATSDSRQSLTDR